MIKENVKIKNSLSMSDRILMPQELLEGHFQTDENGNIQYTPYYADMMLINSFFLHCVEGLTFEIKQDENGHNEVAENIYETVTADEELMHLYDEFFEVDKDSIKNCPYKDTIVQMYGILADVDKMVDFRKELLIHQQEDTLNVLLRTLNEKLSAVDVSKLDVKDALEYLKGLNKDTHEK